LCKVFVLANNWSFSLLLFRFPTSSDPFRCLNLIWLMWLFIGEFVLFVSMLVLVLFVCFRYLLFWDSDLCMYGLKIGLNGFAANTPDVVELLSIGTCRSGPP
jgi:hypothetical protein